MGFAGSFGSCFISPPDRYRDLEVEQLRNSQTGFPCVGRPLTTYAEWRSRDWLKTLLVAPPHLDRCGTLPFYSLSTAHLFEGFAVGYVEQVDPILHRHAGKRPDRNLTVRQVMVHIDFDQPTCYCPLPLVMIE